MPEFMGLKSRENILKVDSEIFFLVSRGKFDDNFKGV